MVPLGPASIPKTPLGWSYPTDWALTPRRVEVSESRRISPVFQEPKNSRPRLFRPRPQPSQNTRPVGAIVGVYQRSGRGRSRPAWLVFLGGCGGVEQVSRGPHA